MKLPIFVTCWLIIKSEGESKHGKHSASRCYMLHCLPSKGEYKMVNIFVIQNNSFVCLVSFNPLTDGGGASNAPPLAKSAPVHQGLTFEWP